MKNLEFHEIIASAEAFHEGVDVGLSGKLKRLSEGELAEIQSRRDELIIDFMESRGITKDDLVKIFSGKSDLSSVQVKALDSTLANIVKNKLASNGHNLHIANIAASAHQDCESQSEHKGFFLKNSLDIKSDTINIDATDRLMESLLKIEQNQVMSIMVNEIVDILAAADDDADKFEILNDYIKSLRKNNVEGASFIGGGVCDSSQIEMEIRAIRAIQTVVLDARDLDALDKIVDKEKDDALIQGVLHNFGCDNLPELCTEVSSFIHSVDLVKLDMTSEGKEIPSKESLLLLTSLSEKMIAREGISGEVNPLKSVYSNGMLFKQGSMSASMGGSGHDLKTDPAITMDHQRISREFMTELRVNKKYTIEEDYKFLAKIRGKFLKNSKDGNSYIDSHDALKALKVSDGEGKELVRFSIAKSSGTFAKFSPRSLSNPDVCKLAAINAKAAGVKNPVMTPPSSKNIDMNSKQMFIKNMTMSLLESGYEPDEVNLGSRIKRSERAAFQQVMDTAKKEFAASKNDLSASLGEAADDLSDELDDLSPDIGRDVSPADALSKAAEPGYVDVARGVNDNDPSQEIVVQADELGDTNVAKGRRMTM